MEKTKYIPIPEPRGLPLLGNILDVDSEAPEKSFQLLAETYGPIFRLHLAGASRVFISTHELVDEVCDEERFTKVVTAGLREIRNGVQDGLFTADYPGEDNWAIAHRVLVPAFGPLMIRAMYEDMYDIASQLALKWARQGSAATIMANEDFTRLTLDTIALCSMGTRFNSFYSEDLHPFIKAVATLLQGSSDRTFRPTLLNSLPTRENKKYWSDISLLRTLSQELVDARRNNPEDKKDLLNALILGQDLQTGQHLSDDSIINNMITFLVAGHETTSATLTFLFYYLLKNLHAYQRAQEEVDTVVGQRKITAEDLSKLPYIAASLRETLRLQAPVPLIAFHPHPAKNHEDPVTLGKGKYALNKDEPVVLIMGKVHRDAKVYGDDAEEFKPERMLDKNFENLPKNAWKPFGNGMRGCIGRPFAWQEMLLVVAVLLQSFNFEMENLSYNLRIKQSLSIKPEGFYMKATLRRGLDAAQLASFLNGGGEISSNALPTLNGEKKSNTDVRSHVKPMHIFFGSNTGTCEALAQRLAKDSMGYGFAAKIENLNSAMEKIPRDSPVVFITASYEGQPPDNAAHFFKWLKGLREAELDGVNYAVFGCGHHDWSATFLRIPKAINGLIEKHGGIHLCDMGVADAANSDMFSDFDTWSESILWPATSLKFGREPPKGDVQAKSALQVDVTSSVRASTLGLQLQEGYVLENTLLTTPDVPAKRTLRFKLPPDTTYQCGDYLIVLPVNPAHVVRRAIRRFNISWDSMLTVWKPSHAPDGITNMPLETPISAFELFSTYVELSQPASKRDLTTLAEATTTDTDTQAELHLLASSPNRFTEEVINSRLSPLDILTRYPSINLPLSTFLAMLPPMRVRQYSISSSPLANPAECSITFSVLNSPHLSTKNRQFVGVASTYLSSLQPGDRAQISIRASNNRGFKPPLKEETPLIMACAGSGLAPFRGFIMDRAERIRSELSSDADHSDTGKPARAILYIGCRTKGKDDIHASELDEWSRQGAVDIRRAYSRPSDGSPGRHVQDLMFEDRGELLKLIDQGARIYVCGGMNVGQGIRQRFKDMFMERWLENGPDGDKEAAAEEYLDGLKTEERYATDVFT
ncbi:NADPH--cytochrome P450 reductase [Aspergillus bombycis]|uniref:Bifunctional cytochrome P450/NADPH--P450 reductase n=1 Tax=Aspergillus bombycis TaxID=109264 RepID=A0A1F8A267_9EURO|nr:NADPH--cytochrome P450 reductase [Aspergillus bombycis]OGM45812.1 NADPH--cytochrome P450 reductase [Aspergillus bombycis]